MHRLVLSALLLAATSALAAPAPLPKPKDDRTRPAKRQVLLQRLARLGMSGHWWLYIRDRGLYVFACRIEPTKVNPLGGDGMTYSFQGEGTDEIAALEDAIAKIKMTLWPPA